MEYVTLKNSNLKVSRFQMGGCPMGGFGWGETNEQDFLNAINIAIENGVNFFDTADTYGLGQSEITLAKGIKGNTNRFKASKTGYSEPYYSLFGFHTDRQRNRKPCRRIENDRWKY